MIWALVLVIGLFALTTGGILWLENEEMRQNNDLSF